MTRPVRHAAAILALAVGVLPAAGQERPNTMIVLDGSGSMWGQVDGVNKIVIARDVLGGILNRFPADENLGLTVYGHRERGSCADIETVVPSGPGTRDAIRAAAEGINPRGKTPMTDAIVAAAEALRYTEERATVVLVSDGIETCNPDPCAAAAALEAAGLDFTAHVVGFDVTDPEALAQMQCLADNTGGTFTTAANADELTQALRQVTVAAPEPVVTSMTFAARLGAEGGPLVEGPVFWTLGGANGDVQGNPIALELEGGSYTIAAYWAAQETAADRQFVVTADPREIALVFEAPTATATITAPATAIAGSTIEVGWAGPDAPEDYIGIGRVGATGAAQWENWTYTAEGPVLDLLVPPNPGDYVITYFQRDGRTPLGSVPITVGPAAAAVIAPATAEAGTTIEVDWSGPDYAEDYLGIGEVNATGDARWENWVYTADGAPATLVVPPTPGDYVIRYFLRQQRVPIAETPMAVSAAGATLTAPAEAAAASTVEVGWTGPDLPEDYIGIGRVGATGNARWERWTYTADGTPATLVVPPMPGDYEITYFLRQDRTPLATVPLKVTAQTATLDAPASAPAGGTIAVDWTGPDFDEDYLGIGRIDATGSAQWENWVYTGDGAPAKLVVPPTPGDYVIRYFLREGRTPLAERRISVEPVPAGLVAPARAAAGSTLEVGWTGPDYPEDYVALGRADATGNAMWQTWAYTSSGNPAMLQLPEEPGAYVLRYFMQQGRTELAAQPLLIE